MGSNGLEPSTSRLSGVRSNHLSYEPMFLEIRLSVTFPQRNVGGDEEDRTPDPLRARQVLSQLSYTPIFTARVSILSFPFSKFRVLSRTLKIKQCFHTSAFQLSAHLRFESSSSIFSFEAFASENR